MLVKNHFDECPYGCNPNGMLLDTNVGRMVQCPYCLKKKKELLAKGYAESAESDNVVPLSSILGIESPFLSSKFVYDAVIPEGERLFIEEDSLDYQKKVAEELYLGLTVGKLPECSYCFGISIKGRVDKFAYPMLAKGYLGGLSIGKFISCSELSRLVLRMDESLEDFYSCDLLMLLLNDGSSLGDFANAKGLMQSRALRGKPTVFITTWTIEACSGLLTFSGDDDNLFLAKPVFVRYKGSRGKSSNYINKLIGVENGVACSEEDNGLSISLSDL